VIEHVPAPIVVKRVDDRRYLLLNRAAEAFFGAGRRDFVGRTAEDIFSADAAERIRNRDEQAIASRTRHVFRALDQHAR